MKTETVIKKGPIRNHKVGKWVERKLVSEILICTCGNKYIKTRPGQKVCVKCLSKEM